MNVSQELAGYGWGFVAGFAAGGVACVVIGQRFVRKRLGQRRAVPGTPIRFSPEFLMMNGIMMILWALAIAGAKLTVK